MATVRTRRTGAAGIVQLVFGVIVVLIIIAIVLVLLGANRNNMLVNWFVNAGSWLTTPFHHLFTPKNPKTDVLVNWGLAAIVYAFIGGILARLAYRA